MKIILPVILILNVLFSSAQIICIHCFGQNNHISNNVTNYISNGSFETTTCNPNITASCYCPNSNFYSCDINSWTCTGGGVNTYAHIKDYNNIFVPNGNFAAYFGNNFANACSPVQGDLSCVSDSGCTLIGFPAGYPQNNNLFGGSLGVSLSQTVNGLVPGNIYVLEFWAGGESDTVFSWVGTGIFAVDIGFGYNYFRDYPTPAISGIGTRFIIEFMATSTTHEIKFTNWGHVCTVCTELAIDDVRLYPLSELAGFVPSCIQPAAAFVSDSMVCPGTCISFQNVSTNATSFAWSFNGGIPSSSTDTNPSGICYNTPGSYDVQLIASGAAGSDTLTLNNYITVFPQPPPQGILQSGDTLFANGGATSYQWYFDGNLIGGATDSFLVAAANGDYNVVATDVNGCEVEAAAFNVLVQVKHTTAEEFAPPLKIFPNPVHENLEIQISGDFRISLYNVFGETLMNEMQSISSIDCRNLPKGIYYISVQSGGRIARARFLKQ